MQNGSNPRHGPLGLISAKNEILWVWTRCIEWKSFNCDVCIGTYIIANFFIKKIQIPNKSYYEIEENYKPHLFISQLLQNLWSTSQNYRKYEEKQSRKEKGKLPKFEHSL
jgi:hypothetical protein